MSSCYSSRRPSMAAHLGLSSSAAAHLATSHSQPKSWFENSSHASRDEKHTSDTDLLDVETLIYKLQMHQLEVEEYTLRTSLEANAALARSDLSTDLSVLEHLSPVRLHNQADSPTLHGVPYRPSEKMPPLDFEFEKSAHSSINALPKTWSWDQSVRDGNSPRLSKSHNWSDHDESTVTHVLDYAPPAELQPEPTPSVMNRSGKPPPLQLSDAFVPPQEVQSATLPPRSSSRAAVHDIASRQASIKKHHRRMTISGARNPYSNSLLSQPPGNFADLDIPPVPDLSYALSTTASPPSRSPATPSEDQIRRELEATVIEEGIDGLIGHRPTDSYVKRRGVFIPDPDDIQPEKPLQSSHRATKSIVQDTEDDALEQQPKRTLTRKKSIFSRFERKNEVDQLLDLYLDDAQLQSENESKHKRSRSRKHSIFRKRPTDYISPPIPIFG